MCLVHPRSTNNLKWEDELLISFIVLDEETLHADPRGRLKILSVKGKMISLVVTSKLLIP